MGSSLKIEDKVDQLDKKARPSSDAKQPKVISDNSGQPNASKSFTTKEVVANIKAIKKNRKMSTKTDSGKKFDGKPEFIETSKKTAALFLNEPLEPSKADKYGSQTSKTLPKNDSKERAKQAVANFKDAKKRHTLFIKGDSKTHEKSEAVVTPTSHSTSKVSAQFKDEGFLENSTGSEKSKDKSVNTSQVTVASNKSEKRSPSAELQQANNKGFLKPFFKVIKAAYFPKNFANKEETRKIKEASQSSVNLLKDAVRHESRQALSDSQLFKKSKQINENKDIKESKELHHDSKKHSKLDSDGSSTNKSSKSSWAKKIATDIKQFKQKLLLENKSKGISTSTGSKEEKDSSKTPLEKQLVANTANDKQKQMEPLENESKEITPFSRSKDQIKSTKVCTEKQTTADTEQIKEKQRDSLENKSKQKIISTESKDEKKLFNYSYEQTN